MAERHVEEALEEQTRAGGRLGDILLARGAVGGSDLSIALADQSDLPSLVPEYEAVPLLPRELAYSRRAAVLAGPTAQSGASSALLIAVTDLGVVPDVASALGEPVQPRLTDPGTMDALLADAYAHADGRAVASALRRGWVTDLLRAGGALGLLSALIAAAAGAFLYPIAALGAVVAAGGAYWLVMAPLALAGRRAAPDAASVVDGGVAEPDDRSVPECTVLVPLRRESPSSLQELRRTLDHLDYPTHKLQALALLEPADRVTRRSLRDQPLPGWVTLLGVAREAPDGRRGALAYGLLQARGELVTVARAEDGLAPDALRGTVRSTPASDHKPGRFANRRRPWARRRLVRDFLREGRVSRGSSIASPAGAVARARPALFCTRDLRASFGWDAAGASERVIA